MAAPNDDTPLQMGTTIAIFSDGPGGPMGPPLAGVIGSPIPP